MEDTRFLSLDKQSYLNICTDLFTKAISRLTRMKSNIDLHPRHVNLKDNEGQANEQKNIDDFHLRTELHHFIKEFQIKT